MQSVKLPEKCKRKIVVALFRLRQFETLKILLTEPFLVFITQNTFQSDNLKFGDKLNLNTNFLYFTEYTSHS